MKKTIQLALVTAALIALVLSVSGCGKKTQNAPADASASPGTSTAESKTAGAISTKPSDDASDASDDTSPSPSDDDAEATASAKPSAKASAAPSPSPAKKDYTDIGYDLMASEALGSLRLGMSESAVSKALGDPESVTEAETWGADGLEHMDWLYESKGLILNLVREPGDDSATVYSIYASEPCRLSTKRGISIGDSGSAVEKAYAAELSPDSDDSSLILGSVYGGIGVTVEDGVVVSIFIGPMAE